jgi:hypothetical protein
MGPNQNSKLHDMKTTLNDPHGRRPQNIKSGISLQPLTGSSSNFKLKLRGTNQNGILLEIEMTTNGKRPQNIKSGISQ